MKSESLKELYRLTAKNVHGKLEAAEQRRRNALIKELAAIAEFIENDETVYALKRRYITGKSWLSIAIEQGLVNSDSVRVACSRAVKHANKELEKKKREEEDELAAAIEAEKAIESKTHMRFVIPARVIMAAAEGGVKDVTVTISLEGQV